MADNTKDLADLTDSPLVGRYKMSSSLKERLKRSSRLYSSPISASISPSSTGEVKNSPVIFKSVKSESPFTSELIGKTFSKEEVEECADKLKLQEIYSCLQKQSVTNEEKLRKLKLVQKHHTKNKPDALVSLIQRWLATAQAALRKFYELLPEPRPADFQSMINFLQIDCDLIKYNPENDSFL